MDPRIETISEKKLIGKSLLMSLTNNRTAELWRSFMPRRKEIANAIGGDVISLQVYAPAYFTNFDPTTPFSKWALVEVDNFDTIPDGMASFTLPAGQYAVFSYKGSSEDSTIFQYIFSTWLPGSDYLLDDRPHFEVLGNKYQNADANSEEEIWVPVKPKN